MYQEFSRLNRSRFRAYPRKTPERTDDRIDRAIDRTTDRTTDGASRRVVDRDPSVATSVRRDVRSGCSDASRSTPPRTISRSFSVAAWRARTVSPDPWVWIFEPRERVRRPKNEARRNRPKATRATAVRRGEATTIDRSIDSTGARTRTAKERDPFPPTSVHQQSSSSSSSFPLPTASFVPFASVRALDSRAHRHPIPRRAFILVVARVHPRRRARSASSSRSSSSSSSRVPSSSSHAPGRECSSSCGFVVRVAMSRAIDRARRDRRNGSRRTRARVFLGVGGGGCVYRF